MHPVDVLKPCVLHHPIVLHQSNVVHQRGVQRAASRVAEFPVWSSTVLATFESRVLYASALRTVRDGFLALRKPDQVEAGQGAASGPPKILAAGAGSECMVSGDVRWGCCVRVADVAAQCRTCMHTLHLPP